MTINREQVVFEHNGKERKTTLFSLQLENGEILDYTGDFDRDIENDNCDESIIQIAFEKEVDYCLNSEETKELLEKTKQKMFEDLKEKLEKALTPGNIKDKYFDMLCGLDDYIAYGMEYESGIKNKMNAILQDDIYEHVYESL